MNTHDLRAMDAETLQRTVTRLEGEYAAFREAVRVGKEKNNAALQPLRATIARAKTVLQEQQREN